MFKKVLSVIMSLCMLMGAFQGIAVVPASASNGITVEKITEVPEGEKGKEYHYVIDSTSEYGLTTGHWEDENGNEIDFSDYDYPTPDGDGATATIPSSYDSRNYGYMTPVKSQIGGTCWAHSATACMEANIIRNGYATSDSLNLCEYHTVWYSKNGYFEGETDSFNDGVNEYETTLSEGGNYYDVQRALCGLAGAAEDSHFDITSASGSSYLEQLKNYFTYDIKFISDYLLTRLSLIKTDDADAVKQAVMDKGAVDIYYHSGSYYYTSRGTTCYTPPTGDTSITHAVALAGWDDDFPASLFNGTSGPKPENNGAWLCKNSWGSSSVNDGYIWISYEDASLSSTVATYDMVPTSSYDNYYQYDGSGGENYLSADKAGNVFTANGNECLTGTAFYSPAANAPYTVYVYGDIASNYTDPTQGTLIYQQSGIIDHPGYAIVPIDGICKFDEGERFSVVVETDYFRCEGKNYSYSNGAATFTSKPSESFYLANGVWYDSSVQGKNNISVKAFTDDVIPNATHQVTFTCGDYTEVRTSNPDGTVDLPNGAAGYEWKCYLGDMEFDGTGVIRDLTVRAHCYPTEGVERSCITDFKCIYCGIEMKSPVVNHNYIHNVTVPTNTTAGYTTSTCSKCNDTYVDSYSFLSGWETGSDGNIHWGVGDNNLVIAGTGNIPNYVYQKEPWYFKNSSIINVYINSGITGIGSSAFGGCYKIKSIEFPEEITSIGFAAFWGCSSLKTITFPSSLKRIENQSFGYCPLESLTFNEGLEYIGFKAFTNNSSIIEINLPSSLKYLDNGTFYGMKALESITVSESNEAFCAVDGVLFSKDLAKLYHYPQNKPSIYYNVPDEVTQVCSHAFNGAKQLQYLDLSCQETTLRSDVVTETTSLRCIMLPSAATEINYMAINNNPMNTSVFIPSAISVDKYNFCYTDTTSVDEYTFYTDGDNTCSAYDYTTTTGFTCVTGHASHSYDTLGYRQNATCISNGFEIYECECGCFTYTKLPKSDTYHEYDAGVVTEPTCMANGYTTYTCSVCSGSYTANETSSVAHSYSSYTSDGNATCTADGTRSAMCVYGCGTKETVTDAGSKLAHSYNYTSNGDATCTSDGTKRGVCVYGCKTEITVTDTGSILAHSYITYTSNNDATCMNDGTKTALCAYGCGTASTITDAGTKKAHVFTNYTYDNNPTCTHDGTMTAYCDYGCGTTDKVNKTGTMLSHSYTGAIRSNNNGTHSNLCVNGCSNSGNTQNCTYTSTVTAPTADSEGYTTYTCTVCAYSYRDNYTPKIDCSCKCHGSGIEQFFFKIGCFFWKIFGMTDKRTCACGKNHW